MGFPQWFPVSRAIWGISCEDFKADPPKWVLPRILIICHRCWSPPPICPEPVSGSVSCSSCFWAWVHSVCYWSFGWPPSPAPKLILPHYHKLEFISQSMITTIWPRSCHKLELFRLIRQKHWPLPLANYGHSLPDWTVGHWSMALWSQINWPSCASIVIFGISKNLGPSKLQWSKFLKLWDNSG